MFVASSSCVVVSRFRAYARIDSFVCVRECVRMPSLYPSVSLVVVRDRAVLTSPHCHMQRLCECATDTHVWVRDEYALAALAKKLKQKRQEVVCASDIIVGCKAQQTNNMRSVF